MHILVVDDEPHFRFAVSVVLRRAGYRVSEAGNGSEALKLLREVEGGQDRYDLLMLDVQMPEMTGVELLDELVGLGISIPVFAVSGFGDAELALELHERGCRDFLDKPFEPDEIVRKVGDILGVADGPGTGTL